MQYAVSNVELSTLSQGTERGIGISYNDGKHCYVYIVAPNFLEVLEDEGIIHCLRDDIDFIELDKATNTLMFFYGATGVRGEDSPLISMPYLDFLAIILLSEG